MNSIQFIFSKQQTMEQTNTYWGTLMSNETMTIIPPTPQEPICIQLLGKIQLTRLCHFSDEEQTVLFVLFILNLLPFTLQVINIYKDRGLIGTICTLFRLLNLSVIVLYIACNTEWNGYWKHHVHHLGHPPLYGTYKPMEPILYLWLYMGCVDLLFVSMIFIYYNYYYYYYYTSNHNNNNSYFIFTLVSTYLTLIERAITVLYFHNLTCASRLFTYILFDIIENFHVPKRTYPSILIYNFMFQFLPVSIHMIVYLVLRVLGNSVSLLQTTTSHWFEIPTDYQWFALYQLCMVWLQMMVGWWILKPVSFSSVSNKKEQ